MSIGTYVYKYYDGKFDWFVDEVKLFEHQKRINTILNIKDYLEGNHKILNKRPYNFNGKLYNPAKIVLNYAKTLLNFMVSYVLANPVTITGNEEITSKFLIVYRKGNYEKTDWDILSNMLKFGFCIEYVYMDENNVIRSKVFDPIDSYPVFDDDNQLIAFIEHYIVDGIPYYTVFYDEYVEKYITVNGQISLNSTHANPSGLPILYVNESETSLLGRSELEDWVPILDAMEEVLSRTFDAYDHYLVGIPVLVGQRLTKADIPKDIIGSGLVLDDGADFRFVSNNFDVKGFQELWKTLTSVLLDLAHVPAVSMSKTDISNLSEVSIRLLFSLADMKAALNARQLKQGMKQRFSVWAKLLGIDDDIDVDVHFHFARPQNDAEIIENLEILRKLNMISLQTALERNPYVSDVSSELKRLQEEKG